MSPKSYAAMSTKKALAAALAAVLALAVLLETPTRAHAGGQPPLQGVFKDNFTLLEPPVPAPQTGFLDADGQEITLAAFEGKVVLLNFWATWCAPCVREMPTLDRLQDKLGLEGLEVLAVSEDRGGLAVVAPFFEQLGLQHLKIYLDPQGALSRKFGLDGLPTTLLIDAQGRLVGGLEGPAEWDSEEALALIRFYLAAVREKDGPVRTSG
jgi:thiol-disulfide isomerase/thioredoxin